MGLAQKVGGLTDALGLSDTVGLSHQFRVSIDKGKYDLGSWSRVSGLSVNWAPLSYRAGEDKDAFDTLVFPGNAKYGTVKLARGVCRDSVAVQTWLTKTANDHEALSAEISMVNSLHLTTVSWELRACYPIGWSIDTLGADSSKAVIETLELAHSGFVPEGGLLAKAANVAKAKAAKAAKGVLPANVGL